MRYYLDTEFIEYPGSIQLISLGIVAEDGRTFYAENSSFDERKADNWVKENVLNKLLWWSCDGIGGHKPYISMAENKSIEMFGTISSIKKVLLGFFHGDKSPEFWGYYADYDWVVFCWIFGKMIDLPENFPMYCRDLKQLLDESGKEKIHNPDGEHNALVDALWNKDLHLHLIGDNA